MITTTVVWAKDPTLTEEDHAVATQDKANIVYDMAVQLGGPESHQEMHKDDNADTNEITVTRGWPDLPTAQAWVDLVLSKGAKSAQVNTA